MTTVISIHRDLSASDHEQAETFRQAMRNRGTLVINLMSSPGAGKTSLLVATAEQLKNRRRMAVLVGDIATDRDAERLAPFVPAVQLTTGGACHLDHRLVERGYSALADQQLDFLFIENIGNLVCPSSHDLGEHLRIVLLSTTEGDDKPAKYPKAFRTSQALVISKLDLLPHVPFRVEAAIDDARSIQPLLAAFQLSALDGTGLDTWCDYLDQQRQELSGRNAPTNRPR